MSKKIKDLAAVIGSRLCLQVSALVIVPIAARTMEPREFGAWSLILVFTGFIGLFVDSGFGSYVIREQCYTSDVRATMFWLSLSLGGGLSIVAALLSPLIAILLGIEDWLPAILIVVGSLVPQNLATVALAELRKTLRFGCLFWVDLSCSSLTTVVAGLLFVGGWGLYSYAITFAVVALIRCLWSYGVVGFPKGSFDRDIAKAAFKYTWGLVGFNAVNYWARRFDNVLIGRVWGPAELGPYSIAYRLMMLPISEINRTLLGLIFPYLVPNQHRPEKVRSDLTFALKMIGALVTPAMTILWIARRPLVEIYLGPGWDAVADLLGVFALLGLLQSLVNPVGIAYKVSGNTALFFRMGMLNTCVSIMAMLIGVKFGVYGLAVACGIVSTIMTYPNVEVAFRCVGGGFKEWWRAIGAWWIVPLSSALTCRALPITDFSAITYIIACAGVVVLASMAVLFAFYRPVVRRIAHELKSLRRRKIPAPKGEFA